MTARFQNGDMIVGYRFYAPTETEKKGDLSTLRNGAGSTVVIDQAAVAGPVYYWQPGPTPTNGRAKNLGWAVCRGCRRMSGGSGRGNRSDAVARWAHMHRCEPGSRIDEQPYFPGVGNAS